MSEFCGDYLVPFSSISLSVSLIFNLFSYLTDLMCLLKVLSLISMMCSSTEIYLNYFCDDDVVDGVLFFFLLYCLQLLVVFFLIFFYFFLSEI